MRVIRCAPAGDQRLHETAQRGRRAVRSAAQYVGMVLQMAGQAPLPTDAGGVDRSADCIIGQARFDDGDRGHDDVAALLGKVSCGRSRVAAVAPRLAV
jgi:hypothetical protein